MLNTRSRIAFFLVACCMFCILGCATQMSLGFRSHAIVDEYPKTRLIHPNPWARYPADRPGPHLAVYLAADADLEEKAKKYTEHLYFEILPCSQETNDHDMWAGPVYAATPAEVSRLSDPDRGETLIKVIVPLDLRSLEVSMRADGLPVGSYIEQARVDGLCVRLGGGKHSEAGMLSDPVRIPVRIEGDAMVVDDSGRGKGGN